MASTPKALQELKALSEQSTITAELDRTVSGLAVDLEAALLGLSLTAATTPKSLAAASTATGGDKVGPKPSFSTKAPALSKKRSNPKPVTSAEFDPDYLRQIEEDAINQIEMDKPKLKKVQPLKRDQPQPASFLSFGQRHSNYNKPFNPWGSYDEPVYRSDDLFDRKEAVYGLEDDIPVYRSGEGAFKEPSVDEVYTEPPSDEFLHTLAFQKPVGSQFDISETTPWFGQAQSKPAPKSAIKSATTFVNKKEENEKYLALQKLALQKRVAEFQTFTQTFQIKLPYFRNLKMCNALSEDNITELKNIKHTLDQRLQNCNKEAENETKLMTLEIKDEQKALQHKEIATLALAEKDIIEQLLKYINEEIYPVGAPDFSQSSQRPS